MWVPNSKITLVIEPLGCKRHGTPGMLNILCFLAVTPSWVRSISLIGQLAPIHNRVWQRPILRSPCRGFWQKTFAQQTLKRLMKCVFGYKIAQRKYAVFNQPAIGFGKQRAMFCSRTRVQCLFRNPLYAAKLGGHYSALHHRRISSLFGGHAAATRRRTSARLLHCQSHVNHRLAIGAPPKLEQGFGEMRIGLDGYLGECCPIGK